MKQLKLLLIFFLLLINSCGYKKLNSEKLDDFKINKLEINGERKLVYKLKNNIEIYSAQNSKFTYDIKINLSSTKNSKIKNTAGKTTRFSTKFIADALITNADTQNVFRKTFSSINDYDIGATHSDTINNEKNAVENNINYISNEIIKYLKILSL